MKLLIAVDGSDEALEAARYALRLYAAGLKAEFVLATVQAPTFLYERVLPPTSDVLERVTGVVGHPALEGAEALFREAGVPVEHEIGSGEVAPTLLSIARARGCEGIFLGARGMGAVRGTLLGSVSQAVLHAAPMPVTVVMHSGATIKDQG
jgi:nucleotide-binding universal stress UspA family protein